MKMNVFLQEHALAFKKLQDALDLYGPIGLISELAEYNADHAYLINSIQNGLDNKERDPHEDPAQVLRELRERYAPDTDELNGRAWFFQAFVQVVEAADSVAALFQNAQR